MARDPFTDVRNVLTSRPTPGQDPQREKALTSVLQMGAEGSFILGGEGVAPDRPLPGAARGVPRRQTSRPVTQRVPRPSRPTKKRTMQDIASSLFSKVTLMGDPRGEGEFVDSLDLPAHIRKLGPIAGFNLSAITDPQEKALLMRLYQQGLQEAALRKTAGEQRAIEDVKKRIAAGDPRFVR